MGWITFDRLGGWGLCNCYFQMAAVEAIAHKNNMTVGYRYNLITEKRLHHLENHLPQLPKHLYNEEQVINFKSIWENSKNNKIYNNQHIEFNIKDNNLNTTIDGFFQTYYYVDYLKKYKLFHNIFDFNSKIKSKIHSKWDYLLTSKICVGVHVRRSDYMTNNLFYHLWNSTYYDQALSMFNNIENVQIVIFSDDIQWCKNNFNDKEIMFVENQTDIEDLCLLSCMNKIIISNSTFSWWGAYLSNADEIISPDPTKYWYTTFEKGNNITTLIPKHWILIQNIDIKYKFCFALLAVENEIYYKYTLNLINSIRKLQCDEPIIIGTDRPDIFCSLQNVDTFRISRDKYIGKDGQFKYIVKRHLISYAASKKYYSCCILDTDSEMVSWSPKVKEYLMSHNVLYSNLCFSTSGFCKPLPIENNIDKSTKKFQMLCELSNIKPDVTSFLMPWECFFTITGNLCQFSKHLKILDDIVETIEPTSSFDYSVKNQRELYRGECHELSIAAYLSNIQIKVMPENIKISIKHYYDSDQKNKLNNKISNLTFDLLNQK